MDQVTGFLEKLRGRDTGGWNGMSPSLYTCFENSFSGDTARVFCVTVLCSVGGGVNGAVFVFRITADELVPLE